MKKRNKHSLGFITRSRVIITSTTLLVVGVVLTLYILTSRPDIFSIDISHWIQTPSSIEPRPTIIPAPSSEVSSLAPSNEHSVASTSYQSTNWAGYLSIGQKFTSISGTWTAPSPVATSTTVESGDGTWIGIGGVTTADLIQVGSQNTISPTGVITTSAFYELLPDDPQPITSVTVRPGDTLSASLMEISPNQWTISLANVTLGQTFTTSVTYASSYSSAEWIQEDPHYSAGGFVLLDNFGTIQFSHAITTMNGVALSATASGASSITMIGQGDAKGHSAVPSPLSGSAFTVRYQ